MASSITASSTTTSIRFMITLSSAFTVSNYMEAGVTDKPFTNDSYSLAANSINRHISTDPNFEIQSTSVGFTITTWGNPSTAILSGHTYTFYGYARAANGKYYQIPAGGSALTVRTPSDTPSATAPYDLVCVKRRQPSDIALDFNITVPSGTEELIVEMSTSSGTNSYGNFTTVTHSFRKTPAELTNVNGNTYAFSFNSVQYLTTYYIHAQVVQRIGSASVLSSWCSTEQISTPLRWQWLSSSMISCGIMRSTYFNCSLRPNQWNDGDCSDYFSYLTFEFFSNGVSVPITHKRVGTTITALSSPTRKIILTAAEIDSNASLYSQANGYAIELPNTSATLTAQVHIYSYINGAYLEPVNADGDPYVFSYSYTHTVQSIDNFDWSSSNGSASASQTQTAYSVVNNNSTVSQFSYLVWNDIVDKVKEVLDALGYSWDTTYSTYANAKMSASDRYLTAVRFNSVRNNIGIHYATGISTKLIGDYVYGSDILLLVSKLNSWIDTL